MCQSYFCRHTYGFCPSESGDLQPVQKLREAVTISYSGRDMWERQYFHCGLFPYAGHTCSSFGRGKPNSILYVMVSKTIQVYMRFL